MTRKMTVDEAHKFLTEFLAREGIDLVDNPVITQNYAKVAKIAKVAKVVKVASGKIILAEDFIVKGDKMTLNNVSILSKKAYSAEKAKGTPMQTIVVIVSQAQKDAITAFHKSN